MDEYLIQIPYSGDDQGAKEFALEIFAEFQQPVHVQKIEEDGHERRIFTASEDEDE